MNVGFPSNKLDLIKNLDSSEYCKGLNNIIDKKDFDKKEYKRVIEIFVILCNKEYPEFKKIRQISDVTITSGL